MQIAARRPARPRPFSFSSAVAAIALVVASVAWPASAWTAVAESVSGVVFEDRNGSGRFEEGDRPLSGVGVSNGRQVVRTDAQGRYTLEVEGDAVLFVIKPRGYRTPLNEDRLPQFFYVHRPEGSPEMQFAGMEPTGPLPASVDFPLYPQEEPDDIRVVVFGDPQPRDEQELDYIVRDVVEDLIRRRVAEEAAFGVSLGDIVFDDLRLFEPLNAAIARIGLPWYNVLGNHDCNFDAPHVDQSFETFQRVYGPTYYAFDYGPAHFVVLNNIVWLEEDDRRYYRAGLGEAQREFLGNSLALVPEDRLVVLLMHIPLVVSTPWVEGERDAFFRLIEDRPHTISFAAHTHTHEHHFLTAEDGWQGAEPHHHVIQATICGSWWAGAPDEYGIPHAVMSDGTPNGYSVLTIRESDYQVGYRVFRRPDDFQMHLHAPASVAAEGADGAEVVANIFNAVPEAEVRMRVGEEGSWAAMERVERPDPVFLELVERENRVADRPWRNLPRPRNSMHLWAASLPAGLPPGTHTIEVRAANGDGQEFRGVRVITVTP